MKVCLIDNYDSFTYNVEHLLKTQDVQVEVIRNDQISVDELDLSNYDAFVRPLLSESVVLDKVFL